MAGAEGPEPADRPAMRQAGAERAGAERAGAGRGGLPADLAVRIASTLVMLALAGLALGLGGLIWAGFVLVIAAGVMGEWLGLVRRFAGGAALMVWLLAGGFYVILAAAGLIGWERAGGHALVVALAGAVIATDTGAYFAGRAIGGPRIAPAISPSKTWAGLGGGMVCAALWLVLVAMLAGGPLGGGLWAHPVLAALAGALIAMIAQAGDFFQSWIKRRAGVKDAGTLIPGHGGLFDRVDGMMAVAMASFVFTMAIR